MSNADEFPCQSDPDLWFSDRAIDQRAAATACEDCSLSRYRKCREEGWKHEHGTWGGLTEWDRLSQDPARYLAATSAAVAESHELDVLVMVVRREEV